MASRSNARLSIVLSTHPAKFEAVAFKGEFEENAAKIAAMGYTGVELAIRDSHLIDIKKLHSVLDKYGLNMPAIGTGQAWGEERLSFSNSSPDIRKAAIERIKGHIQLAREFDAIVIIGLIRGVTSPGQTKLQSMQYLRECLLECLSNAADNDIKLAIEPINRYETDLINTAEQGMELISQVASTHLGLLLDTFHMNIEESKIEHTIQVAKKQLFHFHVADSNRWYPGAGHIDFHKVLNELKSIEYPGWISGEFMPLPDPITSAKNSIALLQHLT